MQLPGLVQKARSCAKRCQLSAGLFATTCRQRHSQYVFSELCKSTNMLPQARYLTLTQTSSKSPSACMVYKDASGELYNSLMTSTRPGCRICLSGGTPTTSHMICAGTSSGLKHAPGEWWHHC